ncbi:Zn-ribbon domain-containing OB-fold protein [Mycolicibacterium porcinum]|nr:OB-fold domain-containing protein [Mycolicibacterium porcinum]
MTAESLPSHGTLWSYTIQRFAPKAPFDGAGQTEFRPYGVGYVAFADSVIVEGRLTEHEPERLRIGQSMKVVVAPYTTTDDGSELVTYAFAPNE